MTDKEIIQQLIKHRPSGRADKYSLNLHRWLYNKNNSGAIIITEAFRLKENPTDTHLGYETWTTFMSNVLDIISVGWRAKSYFYNDGIAFEQIPNFWQNYHKDGKCYLDPEHKLYPDNERWEMIDDDHRRCRWCGREEKLERYEEVVQRQRWKWRGNMAYFANSTEGAILDAQCDQCLHTNPDIGCPIALVQMTFNYSQCDNEELKEAMNMLIDKDGRCNMRPLITGVKRNTGALNRKLTFGDLEQIQELARLNEICRR